MAANHDCLWLVVYDVASDRRRTKMAKFFEGRGERVQESVFELRGGESRIAEWLEEARGARRFDAAEDSLRAYPLCSSCDARVQRWGLGPAPRPKGKAVVA